MLALTSHNGYPVVSDDGHLKGFILRKTLCGLLKLKAFSSPASPHKSVTKVMNGGMNGDIEMRKRAVSKMDRDREKESLTRTPTSVSTGNGTVDEDPETSIDETNEDEINDNKKNDEIDGEEEMITLTAGATVFHQTLEKNYPNYPSIKEIELTLAELVST